MKNVQMGVRGSNLIITADLAQDHGPSNSGKTTAVVSALDNASVPGDESNPIIKSA